LKRLKIEPSDLRSIPQFSPYFKQAGGGLTAVLKAIRLSNSDPTVKAFLETYDSLPVGDRKCIPWEAVAFKAGINVNQFIGATVTALVTASANASKIIAVTNHPKVMKATVQYAQLPSGEKDRQMLHQMVGTLPSPKGPTFIGKAMFVGSGGGKSMMEDDEEGEESPVSASPAEVFTDDDDFEELFPSAKVIQDKLIPIRQKRLGDGKA
jgi:hypothetical protein